MTGIRVLRICRAFPREGATTGGLNPFHLTVELDYPTVFVTRREPGAPLPLPSYAELVEVAFPYARYLAEDSFLGKHAVNGAGQAKLAWRVAVTARRFRPTIIHIHSGFPIVAGNMAKLATGAKLVVTFVGTDVTRIQKQRGLGALFKFVDRAIVVDPGMKEALAPHLGARRIRYVPTGVDPELFRPAPFDGRRDVVCVGRFNWAKGHRYLLDAFARMAARFPEHRLMLVGDGELRADVEQQIIELGLADRVVLRGVLGRADVADAVRHARVLVQASVSEGMPKVLLEALACGTPIVATDVGASAMVLGEAGLIVPPRDAAELSRALENMLAHEEMSASMAAAGIDRATAYTWPRVAAETGEIYEELVATEAV